MYRLSRDALIIANIDNIYIDISIDSIIEYRIVIIQKGYERRDLIRVSESAHWDHPLGLLQRPLT